MKLKAKIAFVYPPGKQLRVGDVFEAPDKDAELLIRVGRAAKEVTTYETRIVRPEGEQEVPTETSEAEVQRVKRHYKRRDLTAEE